MCYPIDNQPKQKLSYPPVLGQLRLDGSNTIRCRYNTYCSCIQEVSTTKENISESPEEFDKARTKSRSAKCTSQNIEPCYAKNKVEPNITVSKTEAACTLDETRAQSSDTLWFLCRSGVLRHTAQVVPPWAGWVSLTETSKNSSVQQSAIDYMAPVFAPVTENATVQHILKLSQQASWEVHQQYTAVTFDLAFANKAYSLVWQSPEEFSDVFVRMGSFHLTCAFMGALGKKIRCSGLEEVLIESGICASGSIEQVLTGKHYNRPLCVHKVVYEALERILLQVYESLHGCLFDEQGVTTLHHLVKNPWKDNLLACLASESCKRSLDRYDEFKETVRQGALGKTAQFWLSYMEKRATKENCLTLHLASLQRMCSLFFGFDHPNYARYSAFYLLNMLNLEKTHPGAEDLLKNNGFSVNRSDVPSSRNAVDITIEQTINRHAKSHSRIVGSSWDHSAYYRWCYTRHARASYLQATKEIANIDTLESTSHKEVRSSQILKSEQDTCCVMEAINNFINPFTIEDKEST
ncbi:unnamed protein product [Porites evermanni]|uniref:Uncharacterized protein n=1 Tax=Porites evermanni TaxID=104178 RepID=A0ABN8LR38_9CNID|nr:unnamed protein product [Porites evermanni]